MGKGRPNQPKIVADDESEVILSPAVGPRGLDGDLRESQRAIPTELAVLPLPNVVIFPGTVLPLPVGREKSLRLLDDVLPEQKVIVTLCQRSSETQDPTPEDLYPSGTAVVVLKLLRMDEGNRSIIVHGVRRIRVEKWLATEPYLRAQIRVLSDNVQGGTETEALLVSVRNLARRVFQLSPNIPEEAAIVLDNIDAPGALADFLASNLQWDVATKQWFLEQLDVQARMRRMAEELQRQLQVLELSHKIQDQVRSNIDKSQREYYLQEQLRAIQKELGQQDERTQEIEELRSKIEAASMPENVQTEALRELGRLAKLPNISPEYSVIRTYLDIMTELPWAKSTEDRLDVNLARRVLDHDHYDLEKVKRRVLEYLAVRKLAPDSRGPILCFVGPPGVGKTSLGQSIARALGRKFIRMSLGGLRDEAELRGHRRTYIGAMPGRVIQEIRKAGTHNPVFMLDEVDKVGMDFRGDPTSALLEILDPAQNSTFHDYYLNVPFDLSRVMFITTANYMAPVPPALRDRMETIELPGYTAGEKLHIATKYLVGRQLKENGLKASQAKWTAKGIEKIIEQYTREAGVRELERQIGTVCRGLAARIAAGKAKSRTVTANLIAELIGPRKYESEVALRTSTPGVATGLAYTPAGGEIIFVEATGYPGKGSLTLTGQIGDVMKESALAALALLKSRAESLKLSHSQLAKTDIHVHVPAGAVPKDGPSAGAAMFTALTSLTTGRAVHSDVAMTGEITLRGLVLPVGGVKEKVLAAKRAGIKTVVLPKRNERDLVDVSPKARKGLRFVFVNDVQEILDAALADGSRASRAPARRKARRKRVASR